MAWARAGGVARPLTPKMMRFVAAYVATGYGAKSAIAAGYAPTRADQTAYDLLQHPNVAAAIQARVETKLKNGAAVALGVLEELMLRAQSEDVRYRAATAWLDRSGYRPREQVEVTHRVDRRSDAELLEQIARLQREIGLKSAVPSQLEGQVVDSKDIHICDNLILCDNAQSLTGDGVSPAETGIADQSENGPADTPPGEGGGEKTSDAVRRNYPSPHTVGFEGSEKIPGSPEGSV